MSETKSILGIDPGTIFTGWGVINIVGKTPQLESFGYIDLSKIKDPYEKLKLIFNRTVQLIDEYNISEMAIEAPFFGKNVQSMLKLGRAQGVSIAAALSRDIAVFEYAPRKIKIAVTGNGNASKEQVAVFLQNILKFKEIPKKLDATDGLAVALCHNYQSKIIGGGSYKSWKEFINKNPGRVKKK
ncbi:MAG: crossover junction endodeoxyribonuclease RuvC [Bacteroidales bacterium]|nr:crossover junction endodeoxyribonuclease RuvC [Bacteroidales bacterium]